MDNADSLGARPQNPSFGGSISGPRPNPNPPTTQGAPRHPKVPYPEKSDQKIRNIAKYLERGDVIAILDKIKNELFGDLERVEGIAFNLAEDKTMNQAHIGIQTAKDKLAGYWEGPAYNAFSSYATSVTGIISGDQQVMATMSNTLGQCVQTVYNTYKSAITFIGNLAGQLAEIATYFIPIIGQIELATRVGPMLSEFVKNVTGLIADGASQIGSYRQSAISFTAAANQFKAPEPLPEQTGHAGEWRVQELK